MESIQISQGVLGKGKTLNGSLNPPVQGSIVSSVNCGNCAETDRQFGKPYSSVSCVGHRGPID